MGPAFAADGLQLFQLLLGIVFLLHRLINLLLEGLHFVGNQRLFLFQSLSRLVKECHMGACLHLFRMGLVNGGA